MQGLEVFAKMPMTNKVALVTGASRNIGRAIAESLAEAGAAVAVNYATSSGAAEEVVAGIEARGGRAVAVQADIGDPDAVARMLKAVEGDLGPVDILVNNAGIVRDALFIRMKPEDWEAVVGTNLDGLFYVSRAVARGMLRRRWGRIINISSVSGLVGNPGQTNYAATKAAVHGFTKALAREMGSRGVTVNAIAPGYIETDMTDGLPDSVKEAMLNSIALGRFGQTEDVAAAAVFLAGEGAGYITGHTLVVDGGMTMI